MKHYRFYVFVVLALVLAACGRVDQPDGPDPARVLSGTVVNWDQSAGTVSAVVMGEDPGEISTPLATGTLAANGSFELLLPEPVAEDFLSDSGIAEVCEGEWAGDVSPQAWRETFADVRVTQGGEELGYLFLASSPEVGNFIGAEEGDFFVARVYVDRDVSLQGTCSSPFGVFELDGQLSEGWNMLVWTVLEVGDEGFPTRVRASNVATLPAGAQWYFVPSEDLFPEEPSVVATGLNGPMGVLVDDEGNLWVIDSGVGGDMEFVIGDPEDGEVVTVGESARVVRVSPDGNQTDVAFLYSAATPHGASGGNRLALLDGNLYAAVGEWHEDFGPERLLENFGAIVRIDNGEVSEVANTWDIEREHNPDGREVYSHPYDLTAGPDGMLYVADAGANNLLVVDPITGDVEVLVNFPVIGLPIPDGEVLEPVPTGVTVGADGHLYVSFFHGGVSRVTLAGEVSDVAPGFLLTDITTGPDGELYVVQIFELGEMGPAPDSGKVYRVHEGNLEVVIEGLSFPSSVAFNARGDAFVAVNVLGAPGSGEVIRFPRLTEQEGELAGQAYSRLSW